MTALDIMRQARERLGDEKEQRWTNNRLLSIVSQGQVDICTSTGYLRKEVLLPLIKNQTRFALPNDCYSIKRVEYNDELLPLFSRSDKDVPKGISSEYVAYKSNLNMDRIEIQPAIAELSIDIHYVKGDKIDDTLYVTPPFGVVTSSSSNDVEIAPVYGVITGIDNTVTFDTALDEASDGYGEIAGYSGNRASVEFPNGLYGVTTEAEYTFSQDKYGFITGVENHIVSGQFGLIGNISSYKDSIRIYYIAAPNKLMFNSASLVIPNMWEDLLIRYTVGTALQDDNDANNITRGEAELQKYNTKLQSILDISSQDFASGTSEKLETTYRRV